MSREPILASEFGGIFPELLQIINYNIQLNKGSMILEPGCAEGRSSLELKVKHPDCDVFLLDIDPHTMRNTKKVFRQQHIDGYFIVGDILNLPFCDKVFTLAFNEGVVEHMDTCKAVVSMSRVAKSIAVFIPNGMHPWYLFDKYFRRMFGKWKWDKYGYERTITPYNLNCYVHKAKLKITNSKWLLSAYGAEYGVIATS
jgi:ubiquinone/menaquinone biosynthesis C-methylase UbiE